MNIKNINELQSYNRFGEVLYILHKNNRKFLNDSLEEYDLNLLQAMCILTINEKENVSQQDLTEILFLTKGGITKSIRNLELNGYIIREKSPEDGRQHIIKLTKKGKDIIPTLNKINNTWETTLGLDKLGDEFLNIFYELTEKSIELNSKSKKR